MPPLLTIAIPTFDRASYLEIGLRQLQRELLGITPGLVEILVSDNCSSDRTPEVVMTAIREGLPMRYIRNTENLGWARNFVQCFERAEGRYVLLMGDDDLIVDNGLALLLNRLARAEYGVVCLKPYGFDRDFRQEHPGGSGRERVFSDGNRFLLATSRFFTLTSACVVNKSKIRDVNVREFVGSNLAVFHLVLRAALAAEQNLFVERYMIASKRQNSFGYEDADVFVRELWSIIDPHVRYGLRPETVRALERDKLLSYYPFYLLDLRLSRRGDLARTHRLFASRFKGQPLFTFWLEPIIRLPRPLAIAWGAGATIVGRVLNGDLRRGLAFGANRIKRAITDRHSGAGATRGAMHS